MLVSSSSSSSSGSGSGSGSDSGGGSGSGSGSGSSSSSGSGSSSSFIAVLLYKQYFLLHFGQLKCTNYPGYPHGNTLRKIDHVKSMEEGDAGQPPLVTAPGLC